MKKTITAAATGLALLAFPLVAADAKTGHARGGDDTHAHSDDAGTAETTGETSGQGRHRGRGRGQGRGRGRGAAKRCSKPRKVGFSVRGSLDSFTPEDVTITVARANKHARSFIEGDTHTFTLEGARVKFEGVTDADASGTVDFADVLPTDVVKATGKVTRPKRGCTAEPTVKLRKVHVERPVAEAAEESDES